MSTAKSYPDSELHLTTKTGSRLQQNASLLDISITAHVVPAQNEESDDMDYYADETESTQEKVEKRNYLNHIYDCIE